MKYKIDYVSAKKLKDFAGMNHEASKLFKFKPIVPKGHILIDKTLSSKSKRKTIAHEKKESRLMNKGHSYWFAHKKALSIEKRIK